MKKNGFTLIEVLAVVVLLGIIGLISVPVIKNTIDDSKKRLYDEQINMIENGLKNWANNNIFLLPDTDDSIKLSLGQLKQAGFLETVINNPKTNKCFSNESVLSISKFNNSYIYKVEELFDVNCDLIRDTPTIKLNDSVVEYLNIGDDYIESGVTAKDGYGKDITSDIVATIAGSSNVVDTTSAGRYIITYSVNAEGKAMSAIRTIIVKPNANGIMTSDNNCINDGICSSGTLVNVQVNDEETYKFHVINDDGDKLTLIMDRTIGNKVAWHTGSSDNSYGPTTALEYLNIQTSGWGNIEPIKEYTYVNNQNGTTKKYGYQKLEIENGLGKLINKNGTKKTELSGISRARLLTIEEVSRLKKDNADTVPAYLYTNLSSSSTNAMPYGYWYLTTPENPNIENYAYYMSYSGITAGATVDHYSGVRPVIELPK